MSRHQHRDGLAYHLRRLPEGSLPRRDLMRWAASAGLLSLVGCGDDDSGSGSAGSGAVGGSGSGGQSAAGTAAESGSCTKIPEETQGPYPADGSNGAGSMGMPGMSNSGASSSSSVINALTMAGIVRSDIRSSFGSSTSKADGVPLSLKLRIVDTKTRCAALAGAAVYVWHCDRSGNYSLYSSAISSENYLRGVQVTDADGWVTFQSIFPACYSGRWPHIHFEVYPSASQATSYTTKLATSQLALPKEACDKVFAESGYEASVSNFAMISLASDNVFSDGAASETPTITGSINSGYTVTLTAPVTSQ